MMRVSLNQTITDIKRDLPKKNPSFMVNYLYNQGFRVLLNHRIGKFFFFKKNFLSRQLGLYYKNRLILKRNCDISYYATLGSNISFPHPIGIVIGDGVVIKNNVKIWQNVTLGSHGKKGKDLKYPIVDENSKVYTGAIIIGAVKVGKRSIVGASSIINIDVPDDSTAVGIPCRII